MVLNNFSIRNPELRQLVSEVEGFDAETAMKIIVVVDNALTTIQGANSNAVANLTKRVIGIEESISGLHAELVDDRKARNQAELERAKNALEVAKRRVGLDTDAKLEVQRIFKEGLESEAMENAVQAELDEAAKKRKAENETWWRETGRAVIRAILIAVAVPVALGLLAAMILFLAQVFKVAL